MSRAVLPSQPAVGIDVGGQGVKAVLVDDQGTILKRWSDRDASAEGRSVDGVISRVAAAVAALSAPANAPLGVAVPGFFDTRRGVVCSSPNFPTWRDVPLRALLGDRLGRSVVIDNDANAAVAGEAWVGAACGLRDVLLITLGTGVGTGFLVNGALLRGARGAAGEGGHLVIRPGGRLCGCGQLGCLETYASGPGIAVTAADVWGDDAPSTAAGVFEAFAGGDPRAAEVVARFTDDLATGIAQMLHLFAPEAVVLGGGVAASMSRFQERLEARLRSAALPTSAADVFPLRVATLGGSAGAVGAAWLALQCPRSGSK
jgi:glucokinase